MATTSMEIPLRPPSPLLCLQITEKLLEAEEKKLRVLKTEIEASKHSDAAGGSKVNIYASYFLIKEPRSKA